MGISMDSLPPRYQKQAARKLDPVAYEKALQFFHAEESAKNPARQAQGSICWIYSAVCPMRTQCLPTIMVSRRP